MTVTWIEIKEQINQHIQDNWRTSTDETAHEMSISPSAKDVWMTEVPM
jgi:hypothetical protein